MTTSEICKGIELTTHQIRTIEEASKGARLAPRHRRVVQLLDQHGFEFNGVSVCDVGCGYGTLSYWLSTNFPDCRVFACDCSSDYAEEHSRQFEYRAADLAKGIPYEDDSMDAIVSLEVIEHMIDTDFFLDECLRILKPGGYLVVTTPNICMLRNRVRVPFGIYPRALEYRNMIHHVRFYTAKIMKQHLAEHGFRDVRVSCVNLLPRDWLVRSKIARAVSDLLSDRFPTFGSNLVGLARKQR